MKILAVVALGLGLCTSMRADTTTTVEGSGYGIPGSGTLYAVSNGTGDGSYTITGMTGTGVTGLIGVKGFQGNDNQLSPNLSPFLTEKGFAFTDVNDNTEFQVRLAYSSELDGYEAYVVNPDGKETDVPVTFTITGTDATAQTDVTNSALRRAMFAPMANGAPQTIAFSFALSPAAATPEPSSLVLLCTGVAGAAGVLRRRRAK